MGRNNIYLRHRMRVLPPRGVADQDNTKEVATLLKNIESLGFTLDSDLIMHCLGSRKFNKWGHGLMRALREMTGADKKWEPMYPNFPEQVMEASDAELYINAMMHYIGSAFGLRILPAYEKAPREPLGEDTNLKLIRMGSDGDFLGIFEGLLSSGTSISPADVEDLRWYFKTYREKARVPEMRHKEIIATVAGILSDEVLPLSLINGAVKNVTDVLRVAVALSGGDVSLASDTRFRSFSRPERRALMEMLAGTNMKMEDFARHRGKWLRLGERVHPGEFARKSRLRPVADAFGTLRNHEETIQTFDGMVEAFLARRDVTSAISLLELRPSLYARRMDHMLRLCDDASTRDKVISKFAELSVSERISAPVLLQVMAHFRGRNHCDRVVIPKGNVAKLEVLPRHEPLPAQVVASVTNQAYNGLVNIFSRRPWLGKVWIDPALEKCVIPFSQRSASKSLRSLARGSRLPFVGQFVRMFLWWKNVPRQNTDIDMSCGFFSANHEFLGQVSYLRLRNSYAVHSGDIVNAPQGACEFLDVDVSEALASGVRYAVMTVHSFSEHPYCDLPECFAGWMTRSGMQTGEAFEPRTLQGRFDLASQSRSCVPVIFDLGAADGLSPREFVWADIGMPSQVINNIMRSKGDLEKVLKGMSSLSKPNLFDLFKIHRRARGSASDKLHADVKIGLDDDCDIRATDISRIVSDFL